MTIVGKGRVDIGKLKKVKDDAEIEAGPNGTFFYSDSVSGQPFPLPAAGKGPAPCFCLVGRIGHGPVFYVGAERSWVAGQTGRLWLRINDFARTRNVGAIFSRDPPPPHLQPG